MMCQTTAGLARRRPAAKRLSSSRGSSDGRRIPSTTMWFGRKRRPARVVTGACFLVGQGCARVCTFVFVHIVAHPRAPTNKHVLSHALKVRRFHIPSTPHPPDTHLHTLSLHIHTHTLHIHTRPRTPAPSVTGRVADWYRERPLMCCCSFCGGIVSWVLASAFVLLFPLLIAVRVSVPGKTFSWAVVWIVPWCAAPFFCCVVLSRCVCPPLLCCALPLCLPVCRGRAR